MDNDTMVHSANILTVSCVLTMKWSGWWIVPDSWDSGLGVSMLVYPGARCHFLRN